MNHQRITLPPIPPVTLHDLCDILSAPIHSILFTRALNRCTPLASLEYVNGTERIGYARINDAQVGKQVEQALHQMAEKVQQRLSGSGSKNSLNATSYNSQGHKKNSSYTNQLQVHYKQTPQHNQLQHLKSTGIKGTKTTGAAAASVPAVTFTYCLAFFEKHNKAGWFSVKEERTYWERWLQTVTVVPTKQHELDNQNEVLENSSDNADVAAALTETLLTIVREVNSKQAHVPFVTEYTSPLPYTWELTFTFGDQDPAVGGGESTFGLSSFKDIIQQGPPMFSHSA